MGILRYGTAKHFLTASNVFDMPIQAFYQVSIGASPLALVPSVYALRADGKKNKAYWPLEGAPAIPSYICAGTSVPKDALFAVIEKLRGPRFSHFYTRMDAFTAALLPIRCRTSRSWKEAGRTVDFSFRPNHS